MVKRQDLHTLIEECTTYLLKAGFSNSRIADYKKWWSRGIIPYMEQHSIKLYDLDIGNDYINSLSDPTSYVHTSMRRSIGVLSSFLEHGFTPKRYTTPVEHELKGSIGEIAKKYLAEKQELRVRESTIKINRRILSQFIKSLYLNDVTSIDKLGINNILDFISSAQNLSSQRGYVLRGFCRYLYNNQYTEKNFEYVIGKIPSNSKEKLPSTYTIEEIKIIETHIIRGRIGDKRNYAMFLLASRLGLRVSDITNLKFANINWESNTITIEQYKTKKEIELPLLVDVGNAIVDYIQTERKVSDCEEVFLSLTPPYKPISRQTITTTIEKIIRDSGIDTAKRRFGMHAMRHTLAAQLLGNKAPISTISEILGHSSTQSTMNYLRIDVDKLTSCLLTVPQVPLTFYNQKGGIFYE